MKLFAPLSLVWFAVTGLVVLLQQSPQIGVFLMILAAPFWSVLTVNLGFIGIAAEALAFRWVSRWWLVLPALWFGGYAVWFAVDHVALRRADASPPSAAPTIAFDPARADLVLAGPDARGVAADLMHDYDLPVVYSASPGPGSRTLTGEEPMIAHRVAPLEACADLEAGKPGLAQQDIQQEQRFVRGERNAYCQYAAPGTPARASVRVSVEPDVADPRSRGVLPLVPMPMMGCGLNSNMLEWECGYRFIRFPSQVEAAPRPAETPADRLASRLGLKPRRGVSNSVDTKGPATAIAAAVARAERDLERLIADPTTQIEGRSPLAALEDRPDIIRRHADRIVGTLERHGAETEAASAVVKLTHLLSYLPETDLERLEPRLRRVYERPSSAGGTVHFSSRLESRLRLRSSRR